MQALDSVVGIGHLQMPQATFKCLRAYAALRANKLMMCNHICIHNLLEWPRRPNCLSFPLPYILALSCNCTNRHSKSLCAQRHDQKLATCVTPNQSECVRVS